MKTKWKKTLAAILAAATVCTVTACGGAGSKPGPGSSTAQDGSSAAGSDAPVELRITSQAWMMGKYDFDAIKAKFEASHPNVTVVYNKVDTADVTTNMLQWSQGKTNCDIAIGGDRANAVQYVAKDYIVSFDDDFFTGDFTKDKFFEAYLEMGNIEGTQYMIPITCELEALTVNIPMMKEAGLTDSNDKPIPPKDWEELAEYAKKLTKIENGQVTQTGLSIDFGNNNALYGYFASLQGIKGSVYEDDGTTADFTSNSTAKLFTIWQSLVKNKYTPTDTFSDIDAGRTNFKASKVAILLAPASRWIECGNELGAENVSVMPIPGTDENGSIGFIQGAVIPRFSPNIELAKEFIKECLLDKEFQMGAMNMYGKMSPILSHYDNMENQDWPSVIESAKVSATLPLYKDYTKMDTQYNVEMQRCVGGGQTVEEFQANMKKVMQSIDMSTGLK